jgi:hypothetical protein
LAIRNETTRIAAPKTPKTTSNVTTAQAIGRPTHPSAILFPVEASASRSVNASAEAHPGQGLLEKLRGSGRSRPVADPELAGGLREWLEDSLSSTARRVPEGGPALVIDTVSRRRLLSLRPRRQAQPIEISNQAMVQNLVSCLFRQWITTRSIGDPLADAIAAQVVSGDPEGIVERVSRMPAARRSALQSELSGHARQIASMWPPLCASWHPRTGEKVAIPLCGRKIILSATVDLAIGPQASTDASVCIVGIETAPPRRSHEIDMRYCALVETLRSGAPPSRVGKFYTQSGQFRIEPVNEHLLVSALLETVDLAERLCP